MRVNEIFYSLQGEGHHTGRPAIFVRFSGCNLACPFCDTDFSDYEELSGEEIIERMKQWPARFVVLTGGEPSLQADEAFIDLLHQHGYVVAMETNGTRSLPRNLDWSTISPKGPCTVKKCNEVKLLFMPTDTHVENAQTTKHPLPHPSDIDIEADFYYLQPCDTGDERLNQQIVDACVDYIKQHPRWNLSLQTHKLAKFK